MINIAKGELAPKILDKTCLTMDDNFIYGYIDGELDFSMNIKDKEISFRFIEDVQIPDEHYFCTIECEDIQYTIEELVYDFINLKILLCIV